MLVKCCTIAQSFDDLAAGGKKVILVLTYYTADRDELPLDLILIEMVLLLQEMAQVVFIS